MPDAECVGFSEVDKYAISIYQKHFKEHKNYGDATKIIPRDLPDFDCLVGGFPCQAFSIAGKRQGFSDTRGTLFFEIARIAREKQPRFLVLENVKGLLSHDKGRTIRIIMTTLQSLGYNINIDLYNSKNYGVPQNRERVFLICTHIKTLLKKDGQELKLTSLKKITEQYLYQTLLNNFKEVRGLSGQKSKDWVIGYLLLKEILKSGQELKLKSLKRTQINLSDNYQDLFQQEHILQFTATLEKQEEKKHTKDGILMLMEEKSFLLVKEDVMWQSIDLLLNKKLAENYKEKSVCITSTLIKQIIKLKTYTFLNHQKIIWKAIVLLKNLEGNSWKEVLSNLIIIQENIKLNVKQNNRQIKKTIIRRVDNDDIINRTNRERLFIIGHLRASKQSARQVLPFGNSNKTIAATPSNKTRKVVCFNANHPIQLISGSQANRVYDAKGIAVTQSALGGGRGAKTGLYAVPVLTPDRPNKRQNGRRFKENGEPSFTLTAQDTHGVLVDQRIRRLTPIECEALQGFERNHTEYGKHSCYHIRHNKHSNNINQPYLCKQSTIKKLNSKNAQWIIVREKKLPISVIASCTIKDGNEQEQQKLLKEAFKKIKNVNIVITKLGTSGQWECVISIIKCGGYMVTPFTWRISVARQGEEGISGTERASQFIGLLWKNISEDCSLQARFAIISTVLKPIIESIIYTFAQGLNTHLSINNLTVSSQKQLTMGILSLKTESIIKMSDSARYKCLGNAVTVNVVADIFSKLNEGEGK
jgi:DNA-cytosine methyltransferase